MINNIEVLLNELGRVSMCQENSSYNDITEMQSSNSYQMMIDNLYSKAVSDLYYLDESQRSITIRRIDEVRERQKHFDVPTKETVNATLRDYNAQPDGKRTKSLLDDYHYCKFVLECVAIQKEYLERFASLITEENRQETNTSTNPETNIGNNPETTKVVEETEDTEWLTTPQVANKYKLPKNNIKARKWRIAHDFPYKGYDEIKGAHNHVTFKSTDVENWIRNHKK